MDKFQAVVTIECDDATQAQQVLSERLGYDEDYGFTYTVNSGRVFTLREINDLRDLLTVAQTAALGDSNDDEIEAWRDAAETAAQLLGITI